MDLQRKAAFLFFAVLVTAMIIVAVWDDSKAQSVITIVALCLLLLCAIYFAMVSVRKWVRAAYAALALGLIGVIGYMIATTTAGCEHTFSQAAALVTAGAAGVVSLLPLVTAPSIEKQVLREVNRILNTKIEGEGDTGLTEEQIKNYGITVVSGAEDIPMARVSNALQLIENNAVQALFRGSKLLKNDEKYEIKLADHPELYHVWADKSEKRFRDARSAYNLRQYESRLINERKRKETQAAMDKQREEFTTRRNLIRERRLQQELKEYETEKDNYLKDLEKYGPTIKDAVAKKSEEDTRSLYQSEHALTTALDTIQKGLISKNKESKTINDKLLTASGSAYEQLLVEQSTVMQFIQDTNKDRITKEQELKIIQRGNFLKRLNARIETTKNELASVAGSDEDKTEQKEEQKEEQLNDVQSYDASSNTIKINNNDFKLGDITITEENLSKLHRYLDHHFDSRLPDEKVDALLRIAAQVNKPATPITLGDQDVFNIENEDPGNNTNHKLHHVNDIKRDGVTQQIFGVKLQDESDNEIELSGDQINKKIRMEQESLTRLRQYIDQEYETQSDSAKLLALRFIAQQAADNAIAAEAYDDAKRASASSGETDDQQKQAGNEAFEQSLRSSAEITLDDARINI